MSPKVRNQGTLLPTPLTSEAEKVTVTFNFSMDKCENWRRKSSGGADDSQPWPQWALTSADP